MTVNPRLEELTILVLEEAKTLQSVPKSTSPAEEVNIFLTNGIRAE